MKKELIINALFFIIDNLRNRGVWGGRHTAIYNLAKGMPSWLTQNKEGKKAINEAIKLGLNKGFLRAKKSTQELHFSLNSSMSKEILAFLAKAERFARNNECFEELCRELGL